eukprot:TRINITY_DN2177_c0_g1_i5.p1 TRINITY_DN2177_c0_g1~~TRINITY_DN2177_c0_g1_i5.p1  ORF type:complete len:159 (+),score=3.13 TRINITY_DN2177_c0_g1_i5:213-689(+)
MTGSIQLLQELQTRKSSVMLAQRLACIEPPSGYEERTLKQRAHKSHLFAMTHGHCNATLSLQKVRPENGPRQLRRMRGRAGQVFLLQCRSKSTSNGCSTYPQCEPNAGQLGGPASPLLRNIQTIQTGLAGAPPAKAECYRSLQPTVPHPWVLAPAQGT